MLSVYPSPSRDPFVNLAIEEALLNDRGASRPVLLFYRNAPCVVIGKNQIPWRECNVAHMEAEGIPLVRRFSGGGAVYHDPGNLNVALFQARSSYRESQLYRAMIQVLAEYGVTAERSGSTGLAVGGLKISGHAYAYRRDRVLHHGTLLLSSNLQKLQRCLQPKGYIIKSHAVASRPAEVCNLGELKGIEPRLAQALNLPVEADEFDAAWLAQRESEAQKLALPEWNYDACPRFHLGLDEASRPRLDSQTEPSSWLEVYKGQIQSTGESFRSWIAN